MTPTGLRDSDVRRVAGIGFAAAAVVTLAAAMRGWPFPTLTAAPWLFQLGTHITLLKYGFLALFYAGVAGLCWGWWRLLDLTRQGRLTTKATWAVFFLWSTPIFLAAPLYSGDVYVYYVDGEALLRGFNPYENGVSAMGPVPDVFMVHPLWRDTLSMYGPLFMRMAEGIAWLTNGHLIPGVFILRAIVVASVAATGVAAVKLAQGFGCKAPEVLAFVLCNPLTILQFVGGAHNDATMLALLVSGLAVGLSSRSTPVRLLALGLCVLGASIKIPAFAGVLILGWIWGGSRSWRSRFGGAALAGLVGGALLEAVALATGMGWGWTRALDVPGLAHPLLAPANTVGISIGSWFGLADALNTAARALATVVSLLIPVYLVLRAGKDARPQALLRALGWSLFALAWLGPAVYPWYLIWGLTILGIAGTGALRRGLIVSVVAVGFLVAPGGYGMLDLFTDWRRAVISTFCLAILVAIVRAVLRAQHIDVREMLPTVVKRPHFVTQRRLMRVP